MRLVATAAVCCCAAATTPPPPRVNCSIAVPRRIREGDRVAARVDVSVADAVSESLVVELRATGPAAFGPSAPGLDPPGDAGDDDVIYAVRKRRWRVRLGARRRRAVWALFATERTNPRARRTRADGVEELTTVTLQARAALADATATCEASVAVVAAAPRSADCIAPPLAALDAQTLVVGEPTRLRAPALAAVPLPAGLVLLRGGRVDADGAVDVVAAWPGLFRADPPHRDGCANASAGLQIAVGTGRGADGRLRLGDFVYLDEDYAW